MDNESQKNDLPANETHSAQVKKRRGWLGVKSNGSWGGHADNNEPLLPGEGHSGWNR